MKSATKRALAGAVTAGLLGVALPERAAQAAPPDMEACVAAAEEGQKLRDESRLGAAREKFVACTAASCPAIVAKDCARWVEEITRDIPSITFRARDPNGKEVLDVRVKVDGRVVAESIGTRAVTLDPGSHEVRFERADRSVASKILLRPGEKNRLVDLAFEPESGGQAEAAAKSAAPEPAPSNGSFQIPVLGWVGGGVAVVGVGMMAFFATSARSDADDLRRTCAPACPDADRDALDEKIVLANVGLGLAALGVAVAVVSTIVANTGSPRPVSASAGGRRGSFFPGFRF